MQAVSLPLKKILYKARSPIDFAYFPVQGMVSAMTVMQDGSAIEVATIGNEGVVGHTAFMGGETSPNELMVQVQGHGLRMQADAFKQEADQDGAFKRLLIRYHTAMQFQISYSAACNGLHTVERRCCRWLLMTQDRVDSDVIPLTHEFLAVMLGVRRSTVTEVLRPLQERGLIENSRGSVRILDRPGLESTGCECYRTVKDEFARLFGPAAQEPASGG